jgi:hypothetical protein
MWVQGHRVEVRAVLRPAGRDPSNLDEVLGGEEGLDADQGRVFK